MDAPGFSLIYARKVREDALKRGQTAARVIPRASEDTFEPWHGAAYQPPQPQLFYVREWIVENGVEVFLDEGPWDHHLATLVLEDLNGGDHTIRRGLGRVDVLRARIVTEAEHHATGVGDA